MTTPRPIRLSLFAVIAVAAGLLLFELAARGVEWLRPPEPVETRSPLAYQQLEAGDLLRRFAYQGQDYLQTFVGDWRNQIVPAKKAPGEIRVVMLGGSALAGLGFPPCGTFAARAERLLDASPNGPRVRLINLGHTGFASAQMAEVLARVGEALAPDLVVTVMGNNEYLDAAAHFARGPQVVERVTRARWLERHLALARLFRPAIRESAPPAIRPELMDLVRTPEIRKFVNDRLRDSLRRIDAESKRIGARLLVCSVPVNVRFQSMREWGFAGDPNNFAEAFRTARWALAYDCPELAVAPLEAHLAERTEDTAARLILGVCLDAAGQRARAVAELTRVREHLQAIDPSQAGPNDRLMLAWAVRLLDGQRAAAEATAPLVAATEAEPASRFREFEIANLYYYSGQFEKARELDERNLIDDDRPHRADPEINRTLLATGAELGAATFDMAAELARVAPHGAPGFEFFIDYCHYNAPGHVVAAHLLAARLARELKLAARIEPADRAWRRDRAARRGRRADWPTLDEWMGVDFDAPQLVDEHILPPDQARDRLAAAIAAGADATLAEVFLGNWNWTSAATDADLFGATATANYRRALELDPAAAGARENIDFIDRHGR